MKREEAELLDVIASTAQELPRGLIQEIGEILVQTEPETLVDRRTALAGLAASLEARVKVRRLLEAWEAAPEVEPASLAWALRAASEVDERYRMAQSIELVWTGPSPPGTVLRRTDQALLDLIRSADSTLYVVTFAAYKIPTLREAMLAASRRGVEISLVFESPEAGKTSFAAVEAMGEELAESSHVYVWPTDKRPRDSGGRYGSLHAKCAVADEKALLVSSANLTEYALTLNIEIGLLIRGGKLPGQVVHHLERLRQQGVLVPT